MAGHQIESSTYGDSGKWQKGRWVQIGSIQGQLGGLGHTSTGVIRATGAKAKELFACPENIFAGGA
jgi:hypothetical protein